MTQAPAASLAEANERVYTSLTYGIALEQNRGGGRKNRTVRFLDFDRTAVTVKETLDRLNGPESALIMSAGHNDEARLARWRLRKDEQDHAIERGSRTAATGCRSSWSATCCSPGSTRRSSRFSISMPRSGSTRCCRWR